MANKHRKGSVQAPNAVDASVLTRSVLAEPLPTASSHAAAPRTEAALNEAALAEVARIERLERRVAELQAALELREHQIEAMHRTSEVLFHHVDVDDMVRQTLGIALDVLKAEAGSVQLYDADNDSLVFRYVVGPGADTLTGYATPASQGIGGQVFHTGIADLTRQADESDHFNRAVDEMSGFRTHSMMTVPVKKPEGDAIGVMQVLNGREPGFNERDLEVLQVLCSQTAVALETARLSQQARKAEMVNIIGDISHDIKNMLTPIQSGVWTLQPMLAELFRDIDAIRAKYPKIEPWNDEIARASELVRGSYDVILNGALEACEQVESRTREIADAVKGEMSPPFFEEADLNELVLEVARPLFMMADKTNVHLHLDLDHDLPRAEFDRKQMYNALYNLGNNAISATPDSGSVTLRTRQPEPGEDTLLVEVEDTGQGMPKHVRERLFTDAVVSTKPGGTGLGTRIVAGVVRRHNGTITVQSEPGKGSTFSIWLPLRHQ
jgi:signal transduction histidine kinase